MSESEKLPKGADKNDEKKFRELTIKRSSVKGQITKFKNFLSNINQQDELVNLELAELSLKLSKFEALSVKFDDLQSQIEVLNPEYLEGELLERESIEHDFVANIALAKNIIESQTKLQRRESFFDADAQYSSESNGNYFNTKSMGFKLPQIQISKFDGTYFRWLEFHDTFESLIHNNSHISPVHKFHYLVSYLEGEAARIISNLEISASNYKEAWQLLCARYNNKRLLTNHHLNSLFNIQPLSRESEKSLRFLVDHMTKNLRALSSLGQPTDKWDMLLIFMLSSKLDSHTLTKWEEYRNGLEEMPTLNQFTKFLTDRADVLESIHRSKQNSHAKTGLLSGPSAAAAPARHYNAAASSSHHNNNRAPSTKSFAALNAQRQGVFLCIICGENHKIYDCSTFKAKGIQERLNYVKKYKLCANCLRQGHPLSECRMGPCRECKERHNSLLHKPVATSVHNVQLDELSNETLVNFSKLRQGQVLLSTAIISISNPNTNETAKVRALLDCGSQSSFITSSLKDKLGLNSNRINNINVIGVGNNCVNKVSEICTANISSLNNSSFSMNLQFLVLKELTNEIPTVHIDIKSLKIPKNIILADPTFYQPSKIDMLIGADIFWDIIGKEQLSLGPGYPKLHSSMVGWLVSGPFGPIKSKNSVQCNFMVTKQNNNCDEIEKMLPMFWNLEEVPCKKNIMNEGDSYCESHFLKNTVRLESGRFRVKLPLRESPECLGDSFNLAKRRFFSLEKRFRRNPDLKLHYSKFIDEYAELRHLSDCSTKPEVSYFLCHHPVIKEDSESTKLRVVFDGSANTTSGYSLNDILLVGPTVQDTLFSILIRARQYRYILTGDIEKMYRQIEVDENDRNLQLILWRDRESQPLKVLKLNTLTYGTASASYLSTRCIKQLGEECDDKLIKDIIQHDFYVDDLICGSNSKDQLRYILDSISKVLSSGCFNLRKLKSNLPDIFENCDINSSDNLTFSESTSTLGMGWRPFTDNFNFPTKFIPQNNNITKRSIMSQSFKIFDPLGLLSPFIILPKILIQKLWLQHLGWDDPVSLAIEDEWKSFAKHIPNLQNLEIPRYVLCNEPVSIELHSFSDASQHAYGACIYVKSVDVENKVTVRLLCAKSKVAPLKATTMPRLELCAALLATRLCKAVIESLRVLPTRMFHWCDSSIVLAWIRNGSNKLKAFAANRVAEIIENTDANAWRYVPTALNPADLISRGVDATKLMTMDLWWNGPDFITKNESEWPTLNRKQLEIELPEVKCHNAVVTEPFININNYSSFSKLQRTFAYVKRFIHNLKHPKHKMVGNITLNELNNSFYFLCEIAQRQSFASEYEMLNKGKHLKPKSKILPLSPFLDKNNLIRVGGRLSASSYAYEKKHPILLHASHHFTKLYFEREHIKHLHAGPQLLLAATREVIWAVNGRRLARSVVFNCVSCRRINGKTMSPKMGNLPAERITPSYPFVSVGLDFAGPFMILNRKGRGSRLIKCYMCLFVCLRYKCLHLEVVTDLTKDAFVMTIRRFIARRGKPSEILCDNGRNFVAAAKEIGSFLSANKQTLSDFATQEGIKFTFSPAYAPHFGGIWEAGVKSAKYHIKRVMGNSHLTLEEISTLFAQVEAILNSRPLCPLSSSPNDFLPLSPGHFLIGRPLTALPSPDLKEVKESNLRRYARLEKLHQHFWHRWQKEYISELQSRSKWRINKGNLKVGDVVLIQEDNLPPLCWRLGRVSRLFPGPDGISRVADVNTMRGSIRRPLVRLCPLLTEEQVRG